MPITHKAVRNLMPNGWSGLKEKNVFYIGHNGIAEHLNELWSHLIEHS